MYKLTGRGWLLVIVIGLLLSTGAYALISSLTGGGDAPPEPSAPNLQDIPSSSPETSPTPEPTPTMPDPTPSPSEFPSPLPDPSTVPDPSPDISPIPSTVPDPTFEPSPVDIPDPSQPPQEPSPTPPEPSPSNAVSPSQSWQEKTNAVMFNFGSAEPSETRERILAALDELIPSLDELAGYLVIVEAYTSKDETAEGLAQERAAVVADILINDLGIPAAMVREQSGNSSDGDEAWRQRADVYFLYVGIK